MAFSLAGFGAAESKNSFCLSRAGLFFWFCRLRVLSLHLHSVLVEAFFGYVGDALLFILDAWTRAERHDCLSLLTFNFYLYHFYLWYTFCLCTFILFFFFISYFFTSFTFQVTHFLITSVFFFVCSIAALIVLCH